jgi:hypothetical protein
VAVLLPQATQVPAQPRVKEERGPVSVERVGEAIVTQAKPEARETEVQEQEQIGRPAEPVSVAVIRDDGEVGRAKSETGQAGNEEEEEEDDDDEEEEEEEDRREIVTEHTPAAPMGDHGDGALAESEKTKTDIREEEDEYQGRDAPEAACETYQVQAEKEEEEEEEEEPHGDPFESVSGDVMGCGRDTAEAKPETCEKGPREEEEKQSEDSVGVASGDLIGEHGNTAERKAEPSQAAIEEEEEEEQFEILIERSSETPTTDEGYYSKPKSETRETDREEEEEEEPGEPPEPRDQEREKVKQAVSPRRLSRRLRSSIVQLILCMTCFALSLFTANRMDPSGSA